VAALARGPAAGRATPPAPLRLLDRTSDLVAARSASLRRQHDRGRLQLLLALACGVVVAVVVAAGAVWSGWFRPATGGPVAMLTGLVVVAGLVLTQRRAAADARRAAATTDSRAAPAPPA
jgi:fatty acid desaturase